MSNPNDGDAAFPGSYYEWDDDTKSSKLCFAPGMTLRDYFAAKAMQAFASTINRSTAEEAEDAGITVAAYTARAAYLVADAMLAERAKP